MDTQEIKDLTAISAPDNPSEDAQVASDTLSHTREQGARQVLGYLEQRGFVRYQDSPAEHLPNGSYPGLVGGSSAVLRETPMRFWGGSVAAKPVGRLLPLRYGDFAKSVLDIAICVAILPAALLAMAVIAVAILIDSGRPIFFVQERAGRGRKVFRMYKFRTLPRDYNSEPGREYMRSFVRGQVLPGGGQSGSRIYKPFDKRQITRVGRILRRTSLDELPQIFNVLRREMSLVGPRPNVLWEVEAYQEWHHERLKVLPGITGLAQVRGRSAIAFDDIVRHDIEYVRSQSLKLDLRILWWTVVSTVTGRGAH